MRKLALLLSFGLMSTIAFSQIIISEDGKIEDIDKKGITRSIVGGDYYVTSDENEDGDAYLMEGVPVEGDHIRSISDEEFNKVKDEFERKFDIELKYSSSPDESSNEGIWSTERDQIQFQIVVDEYDSADFYPYEIRLSITDLHE